MAYNSIFLHGFRAVGKSTVGKILADKLNWKYIEMDPELEKRAGVTINELTKGGTDWQPMRQLEQEILKDFINQSNIVVSTGGGTCVNNVLKEGSEQTFGQQNTTIMQAAENALSVVLTASTGTIIQRIKQDEMAKVGTSRPILNEAKAAHVKTLLEQYQDNPEKQKEILVDEIVDDSISMFLQRKPLYDSISDNIIKTDRNSPEEIADIIFNIYNESLIKEKKVEEESQKQYQEQAQKDIQTKQAVENTDFRPSTHESKSVDSVNHPNPTAKPQTDPFSRPKHQILKSNISAKTKMCIIIGDPVEHSLSPKMHNSAYQQLGIDGEFVFTAAKVKIEDVEDVVRTVRVMGIRGLTCTVPHKVEVMKYLDWIDPVAQKIGAVNTVVNDNGALKGYNTDWLGTVIPLEKVTDLYGKRVALIGAGGAARAMAFGVIEKGAFLKIYNRSQDKAKELAQELGCFSGSIEQLPEVQDADIIINSTPIGMGELEDQTPIPSNLIQKDQICFDAVYVPFETKFLKEAKNAGAKIIHGIDMLLHQGTAQFTYYTNREAPEDLMRETLLQHFGLSNSGE